MFARASKPVWRWFSKLVAYKPLTLFFMYVATRVDRPLMRVSGGRLRLSFIVPTLLLRCRGARTGRIREVPLLYVPDGDGVLLIASNGGQPQAPGWCHNLRAGPDVECVLKGRVFGYRSQELSGDQYAAAWARAIDLYPGYARYAERSGRLIPLFRLSRLDSL